MVIVPQPTTERKRYIIMTVLEKTNMADGTEIQLEDWRDHNSEAYPDIYGFEIGAYPTAKNTGKYRWIQGGQKFRLSISVNNYADYSNEDVLADFEALKAGTKKLEDLAEHFWNHEKDMWYLGMDVENRDY
jgi:hypothetical protein